MALNAARDWLTTRRIRIACQFSVFGLWVALIWGTHHPMDAWLFKHVPPSIMLRIDPLVMTAVCGGMRVGITILMLGAVTLGVSLLLGRVFCGWVCPLGAIFDFYGWFLRRFRVPFNGPSPWWFRFKYYLLLAILIIAFLGGVSPLMGFDPIVLLTRTAAAVLNPFYRKHDQIFWAVDGAPPMNGHFIDMATLFLFMAIMAGTTRLSRIWCRAVCPLGAYLAVLSRNSVLKRQTKDCIQCGLCAQHCPTGTIDFKDATKYNESECIKCFSCSQECPVDANYFTLRPPVAATSSYAPVSLERRTVLATGVSAVLAAPALQMTAGEPAATKKLIRPPMSREERDFLASCIRCGECMKACPSGILKPAGLDHGLRALWSPVMVATEGACQPGCNACSQACPTDAIMKYPIEHKYDYKAGTAQLESTRCISYADNKFCSECVRVCPTDAIAIKKGWEPEVPPGGKVAGSDRPAPEGQTPTRPVSVIFDRCVGCGACEYACNQIVGGQPAMVTTAFGRAAATKGIPVKAQAAAEPQKTFPGMEADKKKDS